MLGLFAICLAGQFAAGVLDAHGLSAGAAAGHELFVIGSGLALIRLAGLCLFRALLPAIGLRPPRIVEDIVVILAYVGFALVRMRLAGVDLSGIVATSAVITAVVAFSMQDTLGNILGGLALQLDSSIEVGDWVKVDDVSGRVIDIRWRHTAIETRNGETIVVPNSLLMKSKFTVIWSPEQAMQTWRRWIWFNVDYSAQPARVIQAVELAVAGADIPNVARTPAPNCVLMEFGPSYGRYALPLLDDRPAPRRSDRLRRARARAGGAAARRHPHRRTGILGTHDQGERGAPGGGACARDRPPPPGSARRWPLRRLQRRGAEGAGRPPRPHRSRAATPSRDRAWWRTGSTSW
ncbi:MAG: mechanosensitive ion channel family protein [Rhodocyclaceae bacterium]|nr:mechanosensitive ion channel family protein [Rhodocyclaceae bacterium]